MFCPYLVIVIDTVISIDTDMTVTAYTHQNQAIIDWCRYSGEKVRANEVNHPLVLVLCELPSQGVFVVSDGDHTQYVTSS